MESRSIICAMRKILVLTVLSLWPLTAAAGEITSVYTKFDLDHCKVFEKGDDTVYAGTWKCKGLGRFDIFQSSADDRGYAAFGRDGAKQFAEPVERGAEESRHDEIKAVEEDEFRVLRQVANGVVVGREVPAARHPADV